MRIICRWRLRVVPEGPVLDTVAPILDLLDVKVTPALDIIVDKNCLGHTVTSFIITKKEMKAGFLCWGWVPGIY